MAFDLISVHRCDDEPRFAIFRVSRRKPRQLSLESKRIVDGDFPFPTVQTLLLYLGTAGVPL